MSVLLPSLPQLRGPKSMLQQSKAVLKPHVLSPKGSDRRFSFLAQNVSLVWRLVTARLLVSTSSDCCSCLIQMRFEVHLHHSQACGMCQASI